QLATGLQIEIGMHATQTDGADACRTQVDQLTLALLVRTPQAQPVEDAVTLVDEAVAVLVEGRQIGEAVTAQRTEQLTAVIDAAIAVAVQRQKGTVAGQTGHGVALAIGIQIEAHP